MGQRQHYADGDNKIKLVYDMACDVASTTILVVTLYLNLGLVGRATCQAEKFLGRLVRVKFLQLKN